MPRDINSTFKAEKAKQENQPVHLFILYDYDGGGTNLYYTDYDNDVTYGSITYSVFPIRYETINENTEGEINIIKIILANVSRLIQSYLESYDLRGKKVSIKTVWANQLDDTDAYIEDIFYIDSYTADQNNVTLTLTSKFDVLDLELPARRFSRNYCGWKFKSSECGYSGDETSCNKTKQKCKELNNYQRFGGFPSIPTTRIYVA